MKRGKRDMAADGGVVWVKLRLVVVVVVNAGLVMRVSWRGTREMVERVVCIEDLVCFILVMGCRA